MPSRTTTSLIAAAAITMAGLTAAQQVQRHPGCPPDQVACTYPPDNAVILAGSRFDFKVEIHDNNGKANNHGVFIQHGDNPRKPFTDFFADFVTSSHSFTYHESLPDKRAGAEKTQEVYNEVWREVFLSCPGTYKVTVISGAEEKTTTWTVPVPAASPKAKNAILFVADGMTQSMITAARLVSRGIELGKNKDLLNMEKFPALGLVGTSGLDSIITDSANSASSYNTGHKTSVNALGVYADTTESTLDDPKQETLAEVLQSLQNKCIGIVSTAEVQDATPAAVFSHTRRRGDKAFITDQFINGVTHDGTSNTPAWSEGINAEVFLGGGGKYFHAPKSLNEEDYYAKYQAKGYTKVHTNTELQKIIKGTVATPDKLLGIFHEGNMDVWLDREIYPANLNGNGNFPDGSGSDATDQPSLEDMLNAALKVLEDPMRCPDGFYLMVEAASVDKQMHNIDAHRGLADLIEYDVAVGEAKKWADARGDDDTLIVVTADHGHGFDVFGVVDTKGLKNATSDTEKRNTIGVYAEAGYPTYPESDAKGYQRTWEVDFDLAMGMNNGPDHNEDFAVQTSSERLTMTDSNTGDKVANPNRNSNGFAVSGNLPMDQTSGVHTLQDVPVYATGPGHELFRGFMDNTEIFHRLAKATGAGKSSQAQCDRFGAPLAVDNGDETSAATPAAAAMAMSSVVLAGAAAVALLF